MNPNTLYYTLSAIPQVIGAVTALLATIIFFQISKLRDYLIGEGQAVLNRWGNKGYRLPTPEDDQKHKKRLIDAIDRRSVPEIKAVIFLLKEIEKKEGYSRNERPTGLQYVYEDRFCETEKHMKKLKKWIQIFVTASFLTIIFSIVSLALTDTIVSSTCQNLKYWVLWLNVEFFIISLFLSLRLMRLSLSRENVHESDRQLRENTDYEA